MMLVQPPTCSPPTNTFGIVVLPMRAQQGANLPAAVVRLEGRRVGVDPSARDGGLREQLARRSLRRPPKPGLLPTLIRALREWRRRRARARAQASQTARRASNVKSPALRPTCRRRCHRAGACSGNARRYRAACTTGSCLRAQLRPPAARRPASHPRHPPVLSGRSTQAEDTPIRMDSLSPRIPCPSRCRYCRGWLRPLFVPA